MAVFLFLEHNRNYDKMSNNRDIKIHLIQTAVWVRRALREILYEKIWIFRGFIRFGHCEFRIR